MGGIVHRSPIKKNKVLVGTAPAYEETSIAFARGLHTREQLQRFQEVHFAEKCRKRLHRGHIEPCSAHLGTSKVSFSVGLYLDGLQCFCLQINSQYHAFAGFQPDLLFVRDITDVAHGKCILAWWQLDFECSVGIGSYSIQTWIEYYGGTG